VELNGRDVTRKSCTKRGKARENPCHLQEIPLYHQKLNVLAPRKFKHFESLKIIEFFKIAKFSLVVKAL